MRPPAASEVRETAVGRDSHQQSPAPPAIAPVSTWVAVGNDANDVER